MCLRSNNKPSSNLVISVERVEEVLQSGWFNGADLNQLLHLLELKVADPDVADVTSTMQLFHRFPSVLPSSWLFLALKTIKTNNIGKRESRKERNVSLSVRRTASLMTAWKSQFLIFLMFHALHLLKEVRCSFYEFSKPIRFCSNLVETLFTQFPIRKCKKIGGHHVGFQNGADQSSLECTHIFAQVFSINSAGWKAMNF